jgi:NADH-quinone oxidoreductase subunit G
MKVIVDGVTIDVAPGTSAIDALFAAGSDVPYFCSQQYMSPIGACRMCLARVGAPRKERDGSWVKEEATGEPKIFYFPNLMATCTTAVMEGMVIDTKSAAVKAAQGAMVEFTLINHPLDCPVCDKGGACELQDRAYEYGEGHSRFVFDKRHQEKHHALSPLITLDRERCIHCKRCVRYFEEVPGDAVLDFIERGGHTYIGSAEVGLPSNFTGNITDICPVGALLDSTSRFRGRNWEYHHTPTTSMNDATGSAIIVDSRTGRIERIKAGHHPEINKTWIDDATRFGHQFSASAERLTRPLVRKEGELVEVTWSEAMAFIAERLTSLQSKEVGVVIRADATLEEGVAAKALAAHFGTGRLDHAPRPAGGVIANGGSARIQELASAKAIMVVGDVTEEAPILDLRIRDALRGVPPAALFPHGAPIADLRLKERMPLHGDILTVAAPLRVPLMAEAARAARYPAAGELGFFAALQGLADDANATVDEGALGMTRAEALAAIASLRTAPLAVVVLGGFVLTSTAATDAALALCRTLGAKPMLVGPMANSYGLELSGVLPSHARYDYRHTLSEAQALFLSRLDPAVEPAVAERLAKMELLVVHSEFLTATAELAQVVLPAVTGYEKEGSVVNLEGRVLPVRAAPVEAGEAVDFTGVVKALGIALGERFDGRSVKNARRVLKRSLNLDLEELPDLGLWAPIKRGSARVALHTHEAPRQGNALRTPSMVRFELANRNPGLRAVAGVRALTLNPDDALEQRLREGDEISLPVGGIPYRLVVRISDDLPRGLLSIPATADEPVGVVSVDLQRASVERRALEVA